MTRLTARAALEHRLSQAGGGIFSIEFISGIFNLSVGPPAG